MTRPPVVFVGGGLRPHEIMLLALAPVFGYDMVFGVSAVAFRATSVPYPEVLGFALVLTVSGIVGLIGVTLTTRPSTWRIGTHLEGGALALGAGGLLLFTYVVGNLTHWHGSSWKFLAAWTVANVWRSMQCFRYVRRTRGV